MTSRSTATILCGFYFLFYGFYGVTIPYLPVWLASRGLEPAFVGVVIASALLPKVISAPLFAHVADTWGRHRVLIQILLASTLLSLAALFYAYTQAWFFSLTMAVNFFAPAILPLMDRAAMAHRSQAGESRYATIRLWGSVGFAVFTVVCGGLIEFGGVDSVIGLGAVLTVACMVLTRLMPDAVQDGAEAASCGPRQSLPVVQRARSPLLSVIANRPVIACIMASALIQASNGYLYSYASLYWIGQGLDTVQIGWVWAVGITAEIGLFLMARRVLARVSPTRLILLAAAFTALRWTGLSVTTDLVWMMLIQCLQAFTLAANNMAIMAYLGRAVPERARTTAIGLYTMLSAGLFMFLAIHLVNALGLAERGAGFLVMAACAALALPLVLYAIRHNHPPQSSD